MVLQVNLLSAVLQNRKKGLNHRRSLGEATQAIEALVSFQERDQVRC